VEWTAPLHTHPSMMNCFNTVIFFVFVLKFHIFFRDCKITRAVTQYQNLRFIKKWTLYLCALNHWYIAVGNTADIFTVWWKLVEKIGWLVQSGSCVLWRLSLRQSTDQKHVWCTYTGRSAGDLPIALHCLDALIGKRRRQVPMTRVFAFVKRLSTLALQMDCHGSLALMALISNIMSVSLAALFCSF